MDLTFTGTREFVRSKAGRWRPLGIAGALCALLVGATSLPRQEMQPRTAAELRALIAAHPDDPARPTWMLDVATELLFESWPANGMGLTALFGLPAPEQRQQAGSIAREIRSL